MFSQHTFLYVEDDTFSREVTELMMRNLMAVRNLYIFEDSANFQERVLALDPQPDVILLDIHIRPINGFEMLQMLRSLPAFEHSRVIALTASVMNEEVAKLQTSGFDGAIAKPLSLQTFPELIKRVLDGETVWHIG